MTASLAAAEIHRRAPGVQPRVGLVLGSGLGAVAGMVADPVVIPYAALPGFPMPSVEGHPGRVTLGTLGGQEVAVLHGRHHAYEGEDNAGIRTFVRSMKQIGCEILVLTGAVGSLRADLPPGSLMVIEDHLNLMGHNPLVGPNEPNFGPRFLGLRDAYDPALRAVAGKAAAKLGIKLSSGIYAGVLGPTFETPSEARMIRGLGGDVAGMSVVPETIVARHCGLRVFGCAVVASWGEGVADDPSDKGATIAIKEEALSAMQRLLVGFLEGLNVGGQTERS
jgi:xanthosine phosphorylase